MDNISHSKGLCHLGTNCYWKMKEHFIEFQHPHLNKLLENKDSIDEINSFPRSVSLKTLTLQLQFIKEINNTPITSYDTDYKEKISITENITPICQYGDSCYRMKKFHFLEFQHPHLDALLKQIGSGPINIPENYTKKVSERLLKIQLNFIRILNESKPETSKLDSLKNTIDTIVKSDSKRKKLSDFVTSDDATSSSTIKSDMEFALSYYQKIQENTAINILTKLEKAKPYNFFLNRINKSAQTHSDLLTVCFADLLNPKLGNLESSLQINFMVDIGFVLANYQMMGHKRKKLDIIHGAEMEVLPNHVKEYVTTKQINCNNPFGTHHTKMMIFEYQDKSIRVVVTTANLVEDDWEDRTQGIWISPACPAMQNPSLSGDSKTFFKNDLINYLSAYEITELNSWIEKIKNADFSEINVFFISSVPSYNEDGEALWGQNALSYVLSHHCVIQEPATAPVIAQFSSIGSLGPEPESWLTGEMLKTLSNVTVSDSSVPEMKLIYPTISTVLNSHHGLLGGGGLPYSMKTHNKQHWLRDYLYDWKADNVSRTRAPPHIKSYCRLTKNSEGLHYFLLTSANLSKAAWGLSKKVRDKTKLKILNYEAGVLFLPQFVLDHTSSEIPIVEKNDVPVFRMPYDLPLEKYKVDDSPWCMDFLNGSLP